MSDFARAMEDNKALTHKLATIREILEQIKAATSAKQAHELAETALAL